MKKMILLILSFIVFLTFMILYNIDVSASSSNEFLGYSYNNGHEFDREYLSEQTNTLSFQSLDYLTGEYNYSFNGIDVSYDEPMITVFTHGYDGSAKHWSNNYDYLTEDDIVNKKIGTSFTYDSESLIEQLRVASNADVYYAEMKGTDSFELYKINYTRIIKNSSGDDVEITLPEYEVQLKERIADQSFTNDDKNILSYKTNWIPIYNLTDIDNHMIIIFNAHLPEETNDYIYSQLDYMMDKIVYDVRCLNNGILPKINLISHSRGGITNMQYTLEHPHLVESLITLGSPFLGSHLGNSTLLIDGIADMNPQSPGILDIQDEDLYNGYMNCWNSHYSDLYSNINFHALAGYSSIDFINYIINKDIHLNPNIQSVASLVFSLISADRGTEVAVISTAEWISLTNINQNDDWRYAVDLITDELFVDSFGDFLICRLSIADDLFIHLDSQLATGYLGVKTYKKDFRVNNCNLDKRSVNETPIVHNLEARDEEFIKYTLDNIRYGCGETNIYNVEEKDDGTVILKSIYNIDDDGILNIPSTINGKNVTEIGDAAFASQKLDNVGIVIIPNTITKIGNNAFKNCKSIESIQFDANSNLIEIGSSAFEGCENLIDINIPNSVNTINSNAFQGCSDLVNIVLPTNLTTFDSSIFSNCDDLASINISSDNTNFSIVNNAIYSKNMQRLIYYPSNSTNLTYNLPQEVREILPGAIVNNQYLTTLNLNNVTALREFSIYGCNNITNITGNNITSVYNNVLLESKWLKNQGDFAVLGSCLVRYKGNNAIIEADDLSQIATIGGDAFYNTDIRSITIPSNVTKILPSSFDLTANLEEVIFLDDTEIINKAFDFTNENLKIKVINSYLSDYENDISLSKYVDNIGIISTNITLIDGNSSNNDVFVYGENYNLPISNSNEITKKWYDQNGKYYPNSGTWDKLEENIVLTAVNDENVVWTDENGNVLYIYNMLPGDTFNFNGQNIYINGDLKQTLNSPNQYYEYKYYINNTEITSGTFNDNFVEVVVKQVAIKYTITIYYFVPTYAGYHQCEKSYEDLVNSGFLGIAPNNQNGYVFDGLYLEPSFNTKINNPLDILSLTNKTLYVKWIEPTYTVTFEYQNNSTPSYSIEVPISDNIITLPTPNSSVKKNYHYFSHWELKDFNASYGSLNRFEFGSVYEVASDDIVFKLVWIANTYTITYKNLLKTMYTPTLTSYTYGQVTYLPETVDYYNGYAVTNFEKEIKWYTDSNFTNIITYISSTRTGNLTLYAKYDYTQTVYTSTSSFTVTDDGNTIKLIATEQDINKYVSEINGAFSTVEIKVTLIMREEQDGYQSIQLYGVLYTGSNYYIVNETDYEYGGSSKNGTNGTVDFSNEISMTTLGNCDNLYLELGAHGTARDNWIVSYILVTFNYSHN